MYGCAGLRVEIVGRTDLAELAEVHHRDAIAHVLHDREVVGDEHHRELVARLHVLEQVEDLRLHRHVERGHRLVADDQLGLGDRSAARWRCAGTGRRRTRAAAAAARSSGSRPTVASISSTFSRAGRLVADLPDVEALGDDVADLAPRVERRDRVLEDHLHPRADPAQVAAVQLGELDALEADAARRGGGSCMIARPVVDFPHPDSPTSPSVSPSSRSRLMPDTACTRLPPPAWNSTTRSSTRSSASSVGSQVRGAGAGHQCPPLGVVDGAKLAAAVRRRPGCAQRGARLRACRRGTSSGTGGRAWARRAAAAAPRGTCPARTRTGRRTGSPAGGCTRSGGRPGDRREARVARLGDLRDRAQQRLGVRHPHVARRASRWAPSPRPGPRTSRSRRRCGRRRRRGRG